MDRRGAWLLVVTALGCGRVEYADDGSPRGDASAGDGAGPADAASIDAGPRCGDGVVTPVLEQCDDSNEVAGDGCSERCALEIQASGGQSCLDAPLVRWIPVEAGRLAAVFAGDSSIERGDLVGSCGGPDTEHVVAFTIDRPSDLLISLENFSTSDMVLYVRGADGLPCLDPAGELGCANAGLDGQAEMLSLVDLPPGGYYAVADAATNGGSYRLTFLLTPR